MIEWQTEQPLRWTKRPTRFFARSAEETKAPSSTACSKENAGGIFRREYSRRISKRRRTQITSGSWRSGTSRRLMVSTSDRTAIPTAGNLVGRSGADERGRNAEEEALRSCSGR